MIPASEALERLKAGNARFVSGEVAGHAAEGLASLAEWSDGQRPMAIVLGCSDSRVPVEMVFDQGLGDLFVIRIAGNIVAPSQLESVEFAAVNFGSRLVVVLGHSRCGAVDASLRQLHLHGKLPSGCLSRVIANIRPSVDAFMAEHPECAHERVMHEAVRANIQASVRALGEQSPTLADMVDSDGLEIVGAEFLLDSGVVDWL